MDLHACDEKVKRQFSKISYLKVIIQFVRVSLLHVGFTHVERCCLVVRCTGECVLETVGTRLNVWSHFTLETIDSIDWYCSQLTLQSVYLDPTGWITSHYMLFPQYLCIPGEAVSVPCRVLFNLFSANEKISLITNIETSKFPCAERVNSFVCFWI